MHQFLIVLGIVWLAVISPGADFAMVSRTSFMHGRQAGMAVAAGIAIACWFHILYAAFGLGLVSHFFPRLLDVIKLVGAAYLIYLGLTMVLRRSGGATTAGRPEEHISSARALSAGILTNGLNPKTSLFVVSLYAQVIGRETAAVTKFGYGLAISLSHLLWFGVVALFLSRPEIRTRALAKQHVVNRGIGVVLMWLGAVLAVSDVIPAA
jgi:threonine/homoserine/homoserine lactone efflux protein